MSNYKARLDARRKAAKNAPPPAKLPSEMTEAELAAEEARLQREIRHHREQEVQAGREAVADAASGGALNAFLATRRKARKVWK